MQRTPISEDVIETTEIPVLDLGAYLAGDEAALARLAGELRDACTGIGFLTILPQSARPGLEILSPDGSWMRAPMMPDDLLINTGDMCMRISNDRFVSTPHRVINESDGDRYAAAFFFSPDAEIPMGVVETCTGADDPPRYEPTAYGDYFRSRIAKNYDHHKESAV